MNRVYTNSLLGQSLLEIIIAMAIFGIIASALASLSLGGFRSLIQSGQRGVAETLAQEGMEAVRAIRDRAWNENVSGQTGVQIQVNQWKFSGTPQDVIGAYTRVISFNLICRNSSSAVVLCTTGGAIPDVHSREIVVRVTWQTPYGAVDSVEKRAFITNWNSQEWKENSTSDFADGTFTNTQPSVLGDGESVTLLKVGASYVTSGVYISNAFAGLARAWNVLEWRQSIFGFCPSCGIKLQIQTSTDGVSWQSGWCGPNGSCTSNLCTDASTNFYTVPSGTLMPTLHNGHRWIRYKACFVRIASSEGSGNVTPVLEEVRINYQ